MTKDNDHPLVASLSGNWHKIAAILLWEMGGSFRLTTDVIERFDESDAHNLIAHGRGEHAIDLYLVSDAKADRIVAEHGGVEHHGRT